MALLFVLQAIPIPFSIFSWIGTLMAMGTGMADIDKTNIFEVVGAYIMIGCFIFVGLYPITYLIALGKTLSEKKLCKWSFLPAGHILVVVLMVLMLAISSIIEKITAFL